MLLGTEGGLRPTRHPLLTVIHPTEDILNFLLYLKREGYSESSIRNNRKILMKLNNRIGTLLDGNAVKDYIASMNCRGGTKKNNLLAYRLYASWKGFEFKLPRMSDTEPEIPYVPLESELNSFISAASKSLAPILGIAKESGARIGEILRLEWKDIDPLQNTINFRAEKGSLNRQCKVSPNLVSMIMAHPRKNNRIFQSKSGSIRNRFQLLRSRLSVKLQNDRLLKIHLHSFRHWYACSIYFKYKDILLTQNKLGHKSLRSTLRYARLVNWEQSDEFVCKATQNQDEAMKLIESGFEFVTVINSVSLFRKRK